MNTNASPPIRPRESRSEEMIDTTVGHEFISYLYPTKQLDAIVRSNQRTIPTIGKPVHNWSSSSGSTLIRTRTKTRDTALAAHLGAVMLATSWRDTVRT
jgi:hypothetical protein